MFCILRILHILHSGFHTPYFHSNIPLKLTVRGLDNPIQFCQHNSRTYVLPLPVIQPTVRWSIKLHLLIMGKLWSLLLISRDRRGILVTWWCSKRRKKIKVGLKNKSMLELGRICIHVGLKWVINSFSQSFNSLIKWKLIPRLDRCLIFSVLFTKISTYCNKRFFKGYLETCQWFPYRAWLPGKCKTRSQPLIGILPQTASHQTNLIAK